MRKIKTSHHSYIHHPLLIAIDGPAGSGKSTTARELAKCLKLPYIDTGAMYRAVTLKVMRAKVSFSDKAKLIQIAKKSKIELRGTDPTKQKVYLNGKDVTKAIREPELTKNVFHIAQEPLIRREMVKKQRIMGDKSGGVMEGRDIGTVVFPEADYKFFFVANEAIRAKRRHQELIAAGKVADLKKVRKDLRARDNTDYKRKEGPLKRAKDAIRLDTSSLTIPQTVDKIIALIKLNPLKDAKLSE